MTHPLGTAWRLGALVLLLFIGLVDSTAGQPRSPYARAHGDPAALARPYADTLRALIVFVQFQDDTDPGDPNVQARGWPLFDDPTTLPPFAHGLLASDPTPPFPDSSLTAYFYHQSMGRFLLYGDVLDSVLVSRRPEAAYHRPDGGYGYLTAEVLDHLDDAGFDFSQYDHNGDGLLDYLFLVLRGDTQRDAKHFTYTGISCLDALCGGGLSGGRPSGRTLAYDGITIDWQRSGSIILHRTPGNILPHFYHVRVMAHELGHDLWAPFFNHLAPIRSNDVPLHSNRGRGTDVLGYMLMAGAGGAWDGRGDETLAAFERDLLGWIDCTTLTMPQDHVVVTDLYTTSDCTKIPLLGDTAGSILYVTNRQRLGPFDVRRRGGVNGQYEMGLLRTTGLLIHLAVGVHLDLIPADNSIDLSIADSAYAGDLFAPPHAPQLTPWTRPNTSGYTHYPPDSTPSWQALDDIRYTGAPGQAMAFDYIEDFRQRPVIRSDSWMLDETSGYAFDAPVVVTNGRTLHIGTDLTMNEGLRVEAGATVVIEPGGHLHLPPGSVLNLSRDATVVVEDRLDLDGWLKHLPGARLISRGDGHIRVPRP